MTSALLVRLGGLGDLLVALPAMRLLRAVFPDAALRLLARREPGRLLCEAGVVDEALDADDPAWVGLFDGGATGSLPRSADVILGWFHSGRGPGLCPGISFRSTRPGLQFPGECGTSSGLSGSPRVLTISYAWDSKIPLSRFFFERTVELIRERDAAPAAFEDCRLLFGYAQPCHEPFAVVHPGSGGRAKRWPLDRFLAVAAALAAAGIGGRIVTGEADEDLERPLAAAVLPPGWKRVTLPPLVDLAEDLRRAAVYVGNDSGVTHLAAACGAPAVAIFRDENLAAWRPAGPVTILSAPRPEDVPVGVVIAAVLAALRGNR